ncbi:hypothetical protein Ancab_000045 [Ancistrocladus abbreviatus]
MTQGPDDICNKLAVAAEVAAALHSRETQLQLLQYGNNRVVGGNVFFSSLGLHTLEWCRHRKALLGWMDGWIDKSFANCLLYFRGLSNIEFLLTVMNSMVEMAEC